MRSRIAIWAGAGFLVAACWVLLAAATHPNTNAFMQSFGALASLTCPIIAVGSRMPLGVYWVLAANTVTYALIGFVVEFARKGFQTQHQA